MGSYFFQPHAKVSNAELERLCVFFLGFRVALKKLHKTTNVQHFFFLPVHLNRDSLYFVLETKRIVTCLSHSLQLHLKERHVSRAILGKLDVAWDFVISNNWSIFNSSGIRRVHLMDCVGRQHLGLRRHRRHRKSGLIYKSRPFGSGVTSYWRDVARHFKLKNSQKINEKLPLRLSCERVFADTCRRIWHKLSSSKFEL